MLYHNNAADFCYIDKALKICYDLFIHDKEKRDIIMGDADKQYNGQLIEEYQRLRRIRKTALREGATETVNEIDEEIS